MQSQPRISIDRGRFTDERVDEVLLEVERKLKQGPGLVFLRGLPKERYSLDQLRTIVCGIGTFFGEAVSQSERGELLGDVLAKPDSRRGYDSDAELQFHNDLAEIVVLFCVDPAKSGGANRFASMLALYDVIAHNRPHLLPVLKRGFWLDRHPNSPHFADGPFSAEPIPFFSQKDGVRSSWLMLPERVRRCSAERGSSLDKLEDEALQFVDQILHAEDFSFSCTLQPGEFVFISNYDVVHARECFVQPDPPPSHRVTC